MIKVVHTNLSHRLSSLFILLMVLFGLSDDPGPGCTVNCSKIDSAEAGTNQCTLPSLNNPQ